MIQWLRERRLLYDGIDSIVILYPRRIELQKDVRPRRSDRSCPEAYSTKFQFKFSLLSLSIFKANGEPVFLNLFARTKE